MSTIQTPVLLMTIKGTALNKGRARVWIERSLSEFGLSRHTPITISFESDCIVVTADPNGKRKVAGRPGKEILDICFPVSERDAIFHGADRLAVFAQFGKLVIKGAV